MHPHEKLPGDTACSANESWPSAISRPGPDGSGVGAQHREDPPVRAREDLAQVRAGRRGSAPLPRARGIERRIGQRHVGDRLLAQPAQVACRRSVPAPAARRRSACRAASPSRAPARRCGASSAASQCERVSGTSTRTGAPRVRRQEALDAARSRRRSSIDSRRPPASRAPAPSRPTAPTRQRDPPPAHARSRERHATPRRAGVRPSQPSPTCPARPQSPQQQRAQQQRPRQQDPVALDVAAHRRVHEQARHAAPGRRPRRSAASAGLAAAPTGTRRAPAPSPRTRAIG